MLEQPLIVGIFNEIVAIWTEILNFLGRAWWVEVLTAQPKCTYYFGPFADNTSAAAKITGYVEDLEGELAEGILTQVKRCKPDQLTIEHSDDRTW
jgi:Domain of unknown function (DUF1816)